MATAALSIGQQALSVISGLWVGHEIRAKDAQNENAAATQIVPQWDSFFKAIIDAYNTGQASADQCLQALETMDAQTEQELHSFVGKPGTYWTDYSALTSQCGGGSSAHCNKTCTVGCCIYFTYLRPTAFCAMSYIQSGKSGSVTRGQLMPSKYGFPGFPPYTLQIAARPSRVSSVEGTLSSIEQALGVGGGSGQALIGGGYAAPPGTFSTAIGRSPDYTKWLLIGGGLLLLLLLLGGKRV